MKEETLITPSILRKRKHNFKSHIAVRKETLKEFRELKDEPGSDAFVKKLLKLYVREKNGQ